MRNFLLIAFSFILAVIVGFGSTFYLLEDGKRISARTYGVWFGWPEIGSPDISPYQRADLARSGVLSLGRAEGIVFYAQTDENGDSLNSKCTYSIAGQMPRSSAWTIQSAPRHSGYIASSKAQALPTGPFFRSSHEINYQDKGTFDLTVAHRAMPNNWLPTPEGEFQLILRIYDTNAFVIVGHETVSLPTVVKKSCV